MVMIYIVPGNLMFMNGTKYEHLTLHHHNHIDTNTCNV